MPIPQVIGYCVAFFEIRKAQTPGSTDPLGEIDHDALDFAFQIRSAFLHGVEHLPLFQERKIAMEDHFHGRLRLRHDGRFCPEGKER
jgi:hypothetical protein